MKYTAKGEHNRHFELFDENGNSIGKVDYNNWFSIKVDIIYKDETYKVAPANFWHTAINVTKDEQLVAELKVNWTAQMVVHIMEGKSYLLKPNFWHNKLTLYTQDEQGIITLHPDFVWSKFSFNYEIETNDNYDEGKDGLLLLMLIYCCNNMQRQTAAV